MLNKDCIERIIYFSTASILDKNTKGLITSTIENKTSLKISPTGQIIMQNVSIDKSNCLENTKGWSSVFSCLNKARFGISWGVLGAIAALFHDVFIILGIFSVFNLAFDLSVLAAILAIVGYSLNDSIVVSDRIRENFLDPNKKGSSEVLINDSLNQVFARTIITSFTTLLVLMALLFAGGEALKNFSLALAIGVVIGSYSSIFIVVKVLLATNLSNQDT